ncbi:Cysteine-rich_membrane protein 2 [Hexamita inflata]|uniref:Cysteine-rich membrane protein 2 n=1 Tax=Hexamita inflata TaxID=28002 RepID=A0AA86PLE9_9EUKA|nr:Cysteine-rich membrane protein 2 [Hexamita inflata]
MYDQGMQQPGMMQQPPMMGMQQQMPMQPQMQMQGMQPQMQMQVGMQPQLQVATQMQVGGQVFQQANGPTTVVVINSGLRAISCPEIVCECKAPQFECCQCFCGFWTLWAGAGLECCCCYGCGRPECCAVCCAGVSLHFLSGVIYGLIVSCIVGCRMMCE